MNRDEVIACCRAKPCATFDFPFDDRTMTIRVGGKMFALLDIMSEIQTVNLKCDPEFARDLRAAFPAVKPGFHMNKEHWNTITLDGSLPEETLSFLIERSYALVVSGLSSVARRTAGLPDRKPSTSA